MKYLLRVFLFNLFALWLVKELFPGLIVTGGVQTVLLASVVLSLLMIIVRPMLKILFIPFNFLTFGIAGWFVNAVVIYILTLLVPEVVIRSFEFPGFSWGGFVIPSANISYIWSVILVTVSVTVLSHILHDVSET